MIKNLFRLLVAIFILQGIALEAGRHFDAGMGTSHKSDKSPGYIALVASFKAGNVTALGQIIDQLEDDLAESKVPALVWIYLKSAKVFNLASDVNPTAVIESLRALQSTAVAKSVALEAALIDYTVKQAAYDAELVAASRWFGRGPTAESLAEIQAKHNAGIEGAGRLVLSLGGIESLFAVLEAVRGSAVGNRDITKVDASRIASHEGISKLYATLIKLVELQKVAA